MFQLTDDYLALGDLLETALKAVPDIRKVSKLDDLAELDEVQHTPALFYVYYGDKLPETAQGGTSMQIVQTWLVVLVTRNSIHETPGKHLANTIKAVAGKRTGDAGPWLRVNTPIKPRYSKGFGFFPMAFQCQTKLINKGT